MFEVSILIPVADNAGVAFTTEHHAAFESFVLTKFGGFSWRGTLSGGWVDGGREYRDTTREFVIAVASLSEGAKVAEVVDFAKAHYRQEAIYIRYLGQAEII